MIFIAFLLNTNLYWSTIDFSYIVFNRCKGANDAADSHAGSRSVATGKPFPQNDVISGIIKPNITESESASQIKSCYDT